MADKKPDKKKEAPPSKTGHDVLWELIGFFLVIVVLLSAVTRFSILDFLTSSTNVNNQNTNQVLQGDYGFWEGLINKTEGTSLPS